MVIPHQSMQIEKKRSDHYSSEYPYSQSRRRLMGHHPSETTSQVNNADRISDLPPEIKVMIISLLPFEEAVRTSVLSKQWLEYWRLVPTLDLQIKVTAHPIWESCSPNLDLILSRLPCASIQRCRLSFPNFSESNHRQKLAPYLPTIAKRWLSDLRTRGLTELSLSARAFVPVYLLSQLGQSLTVLTFNGVRLGCNGDRCNIIRQCRGRCLVSGFFQLGTLKKLQIQCMSLCTRALESLIYRCPALESLVVNSHCDIHGTLDISSCSKLRFLECRSSWVVFKFNSQMELDIVKMDLLSIPYHDVDDDDIYEQGPGGKVRELVRNCRHVHTLYMGANFLKYFARDFVRWGWDCKISFPNLRKLSLGFSFFEHLRCQEHRRCQVFLIVHLLEVSPELQDLEFIYEKSCKEKEDLWAIEVKGSPLGFLRRVKICRELPLRFVRYLLWVTPALETLSVVIDGEEQKEQILKMEKASKNANILFEMHG